ncbi:TlyA family RNA methyltransferase [Candidatus Acetothermia bacterium]|nr:TlyA family RNA methyltransferase [Candidatus Acetothermia bacterium]
MKSPKQRLDILLVERKLFETRSAAQREILAGNVFVNGQLADKPGTQISVDSKIEIRAKNPYVSQGGLKLEKALREFAIDVTGKICLDIGASTGGFTDCLLQHGAKKIFSVDVGKGQLDWKLRNDPRVVVLEEVNARYLKPEQIGELADLATVDVSFISLKLVLPALIPIVEPDGVFILLVKPQFEAGREHVGRGGVVKSREIHLAVLRELTHFIQNQLKLSVINGTFSPIKGPAGNIEFLLHVLNSSDKQNPLNLEQIVSGGHAQLGEK